jgi:hypothetical protein
LRSHLAAPLILSQRPSQPRPLRQLATMIHRCRSQVWEYATGKRPVPKLVELRMEQLAQDCLTPD